MKATYWQRGESLDYKNETTEIIQANTVIPVGSRIGVTGTEIAPKQTGTLHMTGVFEIEKKASEEIEIGESLFFDENGVTKTETGVTAGYAAGDSKAEEKTIFVKLLG